MAGSSEHNRNLVASSHDSAIYVLNLEGQPAGLVEGVVEQRAPVAGAAGGAPAEEGGAGDGLA